MDAFGNQELAGCSLKYLDTKKCKATNLLVAFLWQSKFQKYFLMGRVTFNQNLYKRDKLKIN